MQYERIIHPSTMLRILATVKLLYNSQAWG